MQRMRRMRWMLLLDVDVERFFTGAGFSASGAEHDRMMDPGDGGGGSSGSGGSSGGDGGARSGWNRRHISRSRRRRERSIQGAGRRDALPHGLDGAVRKTVAVLSVLVHIVAVVEHVGELFRRSADGSLPHGRIRRRLSLQHQSSKQQR